MRFPFGKHDSIKVVVALSIIVAFDFMIYAVTFVEIPESNRELWIHAQGMIDSAFVGMLVAYYYTRGEKTQHKEEKPKPINGDEDTPA